MKLYIGKLVEGHRTAPDIATIELADDAAREKRCLDEHLHAVANCSHLYILGLQLNPVPSDLHYSGTVGYGELFVDGGKAQELLRIGLEDVIHHVQDGGLIVHPRSND